MTEFAQNNKWERPIYPQLTSENYRVSFPELESNIESRALDLSEIGSFDLRNTLIDVVTWDIDHPPAPDGTKVARYPQPPAEIPAHAPSRERALFNENKRIAALAANNERVLRNQMDPAFGIIGERIKIPGTGYKTIPTADLMSKMKAICVTTIADITSLQTQLVTWDHSKDFETNVIARNRIIYLLNQAHLCLQDFEKISSFIAATKGDVQIAEVLKAYHIGHATYASQNYEEMIQFFRDQLPIVQAAAAASASAMHASADAAELAAFRLDKIAKANSAAASAPPNGGQRGGPGRGGRGGRGGRNSTGRGTARPTFYCYKHGSKSGHAGSICNDMKNDSSYTQEMRDATGPLRLKGNDGVWYNGAA